MRSCIQHRNSNFISYTGLSPDFRAFVANLDSVQAPKNIQEALNQPRWKNVVCEEIKALEKNNTWDIIDLPKGKKQLDVSGYSP